MANFTPSNVAVQVAKTFIARAAELEHSLGKGVKRDRAALDFVCGAAAGVSAMSEHGDNAPEYKSLEMVAFMVASRGFAFLVEIAEGSK